MFHGEGSDSNVSNVSAYLAKDRGGSIVGEPASPLKMPSLPFWATPIWHGVINFGEIFCAPVFFIRACVDRIEC